MSDDVRTLFNTNIVSNNYKLKKTQKLFNANQKILSTQDTKDLSGSKNEFLIENHLKNIKKLSIMKPIK